MIKRNITGFPIPVDGYNTIGLDRSNHGNIGIFQAEINSNNQPQTWTFLIGVKEDGSDTDKLAASSWLYPAEISTNKNVAYKGLTNPKELVI